MPKKITKHSAPQTHVVDAPQVLGAYIRAARTQAGISMIDAASLCGVSVQFLNDLEHGKASIHLGKALSVAHQFGLELHVFSKGDLEC